jgi:uncharacterized phage protein gp47/JayE
MRPIPTTVEINENLTNDFRSKLNLFPTFLKKVLNAFVAVLSAQFKLLYLYLSDIQNNLFPDTADIESNGGTLERMGRIYLNRNPKPATVGVFQIELSGTLGAEIRSGLTFKANENAKSPGKLFITDTIYTLTGSSDIIEVRALEAGILSDLNINDELTITEPVIGVENLVTVISIVEQPIESESIEIYRQAILDAIQLEPQGGSRTDYRLWASDAQGVRLVFPYVKIDNSGVVQVYVEATTQDSTDGFGTPSGTLLTDVNDVIEFDPDDTKPLNERGRRPIQAIMEVLSISTIPVDVEITGLSDDSISVRDSIESIMANYLYDVRPYVAGADLPRNKNDVLYSARLQSVATDVLESSNFFTGFSMFVDGVGVISSTFSLGNIPYLRNVTYV